MANSANNLSAFTPKYWAKEVQIIFFKECVALGLANTELRSVLNNGDTVYKPYRSYLAAQTYSKGVDISTFNEITATEEYLTVDTAKVVPFYVDKIIYIVHNKFLKLLETLIKRVSYNGMPQMA